MNSGRWAVAAGAAAVMMGAGLVVRGAGVAGVAGEGAQPPGAAEPAVQAADLGADYPVVIPRGTYQALVISVRPRDGDAGRSPVAFVIRSRDGAGRVSDFPVFVRPGDVHTVTFPGGWTPPTAAELMSPGAVAFAAWGVSGLPGDGRGGQLVRFEPLKLPPLKDAADRARAREFEEFLREVERNR